MTSGKTATPSVTAFCLEGLLRLKSVGLYRNNVDETNQHLCSAWEPVIRFDDNGVVVQLDFVGCRLRKGLPEESLNILQEFFSGTVTSLNLGGTDLPPKDTAEMLQQCFPHVSEVHLGGNNLMDTGVQILATDWLVTCSTLKVLDLRYNEIQAQGCSDLCSALQKQSTLINLYLEGNRLQDEGATVLAKWLAQSDCPLVEVFLGSNNIGPSGAKALAEALPTNTTLTKLYLECNRIQEAGAEVFTQVLTTQEENKSCIILKHLYCDNNEIGKDASKRLAQALNGATAIGDSLFD